MRLFAENQTVFVHEKFTSAQDVIEKDSDIVSDTIQVEKFSARQYVADTDTGQEIKEQIKELEELLKEYQS